MPTPLAEGAPVRLSDRETTAADVKSGLFYPHYRGLTGTIVKLYADGTATVTIDSGKPAGGHSETASGRHGRHAEKVAGRSFRRVPQQALGIGKKVRLALQPAGCCR